MMGTIVATFLLCWFPFGLMFAGSPFSKTLEKMFEDNQEIIDLITWIGKLLYCIISFFIVSRGLFASL